MSDRTRGRSSAAARQIDHIGAVIVSAGSSTRMTGLDKTLHDIGGIPMIGWSVRAFERAKVIDKMVVVVSNKNLGSVADLGKKFGWSKVVNIVEGGPRRQDSVRIGLEALGNCDWVLIHDGARPFVTEELIVNALAAAQTTGASVPGIPVKDTIKKVPDGIVVIDTLDRERLRAVQTPQAFRGALLREAHANITDAVSDDAAMVEIQGSEVRLFEGDERNIKITTRWDLVVAEASIANRSDASGVVPRSTIVLDQ